MYAIDKTASITSVGVPTLFIGNHVLNGEPEIRNRLEQIILEERSAPSGKPGKDSTANLTGTETSPATVTTLTIPLVVFCALIDSVNPCAFSVLIILLLSIISLQTRRQVLLVGATYIVAVFCFYILSGIGIFSFIHLSGFSGLISTVAAVLAIILGLVNIIDVAWKKEGFVLAIPESKKPVIDRYIKAASLPAAFVLGILVGIFELPCTGGIYLAILSLMSNTLTLSQGIPYLILYNFIFVLPLIVILAVVVLGIPPERINSWRLENRRRLRFAIGLAMIFVGIIILFAPRFL